LVGDVHSFRYLTTIDVGAKSNPSTSNLPWKWPTP